MKMMHTQNRDPQPTFLIPQKDLANEANLAKTMSNNVAPHFGEICIHAIETGDPFVKLLAKMAQHAMFKGHSSDVKQIFHAFPQYLLRDYGYYHYSADLLELPFDDDTLHQVKQNAEAISQQNHKNANMFQRHLSQAMTLADPLDAQLLYIQWQTFFDYQLMRLKGGDAI